MCPAPGRRGRPNGCGKSNVIDAVRLGASAKSQGCELRGESMQDGDLQRSSQQQAGGRASVELLFDNTGTPEQRRARRAVGELRRDFRQARVDRDGSSNYSINNQGVRRRDVAGHVSRHRTGAACLRNHWPGDITRIIEARPEELRIFLEEAAAFPNTRSGGAKRKTGSPTRATNLTRVEDIVRELASQIDKLEQQAEIAQRYRLAAGRTRRAAAIVVAHAQT